MHRRDHLVCTSIFFGHLNTMFISGSQVVTKSRGLTNLRHTDSAALSARVSSPGSDEESGLKPVAPAVKGPLAPAPQWWNDEGQKTGANC